MSTKIYQYGLRIMTLILLIMLLNNLSGQTTLWTNRLNGNGDNSDRYNDIIKDASGNMYLAGYTVRPGAGKDVLLVKMNSLGDTLWTRTYNYAANKDDEANFIAIDALGNITITGSSDGGSGDTKADILTIQYNPSGTLQWAVRYNYAIANEDEFPTGLTINSSNEIFITGRSDHDSGNIDDIVTLKYNSSGVLQWNKRYDGGGTDRSIGVVANSAGGCSIAGRTFNGSNDDFITITYQSDGSILWSSTYGGPAGDDDRPEAIALTSAEKVVVAGKRANASDDDFFTITYNTDGTVAWQVAYNGGDNERITTMIIDASNNIYVSGQSDIDPSGGGTNYDYRTIKYNSSGVQQWMSTTGGAGAQEDVPSVIFLDASGNIYVTGKSDASAGAAIDYQFMTVKYNSSGTLQWTKTQNGTEDNGEDIPSGMIADASGNIWVSGSLYNSPGQKDAALLAYSGAGLLLELNNLNGKGDFNDKVAAITTDASNNILLTGYTISSEKQRDILIQKINSAGATQWTRTIDATTENDEGAAITTDASGNVFIAGYSNGVGTYDDIRLLKYNSSGVLQLDITYNGPTSQLDKAEAIWVSPSGDIFLAGYTDSDPDVNVNNYDYIILKYNSLGILQWVASYNGLGNGSDKAFKINAIGNRLYVSGTSFNGSNNDIVTIKLEMASGLQLAMAAYNGVGSADDEMEDMITFSNKILVTGMATMTGGNNDIVTIAYDTTLTSLWTATYNGAASGVDRGYGISASGSDVYVTGSTTGTTSGSDIAMIKYNLNTGIKNWAKIYKSSGSFEDIGYSIAVDPASGQIYAAGESGNATNISDYVVMNYNSAGKKVMTPKYNGTGSGEDIAKKLLLDNLGYLYVSGYSTGTSNSNFDFTTIKYCTPVPTATITAAGPTSFCAGGSVVLNATTGVGLSYQWKKGAVILAGETGSSYTATTAGSYKVDITNANGCVATSKAISVSVPCREGELIDAQDSWSSISPNPFGTSTYLYLSTIQKEETLLEVYNIHGELLVNQSIPAGASSLEWGDELIPGIYIAKWIKGNQIESFTVIKTQ